MPKSMTKPRVAVLAGELSLERDVSLRSGQRVAQLLQERGYEVSQVDVDQEMPQRLDAADVAFMALHGSNGEDGVIQSLLEFLNMPYTGSSVYASALAWHKPIAKDAALRSWGAIGARQIGRVDLIVDKAGMPWILEFATCPGLTETSV
ncbi:MAG: hypothetical protein ACRD0K_00615 [Egibacteraceae bacterium]